MIRALSPHEAQSLIAEGTIDVVDVREPHEHAGGHLPGARNVPLAQLEADPRAALPRDRVLLVCARGMRSQRAAEIAERIGHADVYHLDGGTQAWLGAGLAVERPAPAVEVASSGEREPVGDAGCGLPEPGLDVVVGANMRTLRMQRNLTLDQLARTTGLSRTLLGQIEIGKTPSSVSTVWRIAQALGVPFSSLLASAERRGTSVLRAAGARRLVSPDGRFSSRALYPFDEKPEAELYEVRLAAHSREDALAHQPGTRENLVITAGRLELHVGGEHHELAKGDAIVFTADVPHSYVNPGSEECVMVLLMTYSRREA